MKDQLEISTNKSRLNVEMIYNFLSKESYWAQERSFETIQKSIKNSLCFGLYLNKEQIGFATIVSDFSVFAWLMDVFILEKYRNKGHGKLLVKEIKNHPELRTIKRWGLCTEDAHELYKQIGFQSLENPEFMMECIQ